MITDFYSIFECQALVLMFRSVSGDKAPLESGAVGGANVGYGKGRLC